MAKKIVRTTKPEYRFDLAFTVTRVDGEDEEEVITTRHSAKHPMKAVAKFLKWLATTMWGGPA